MKIEKNIEMPTVAGGVMNATERKKRSRIAERLGLVTAPRGYVTPSCAGIIELWIAASEDEIIKATQKEPKT